MSPIDWEWIRNVYEMDRAEQTAKRALVRTGDPVCGYCRKYWRSWPISNPAAPVLDGHVRCIVSHEFKVLLVDAIRRTSAPMYEISERTGIPHNWIRAWWNAAS